MPPSRPHRALLALCSLVALGIGGWILLDPVAFHANHGIELARDPDLLSEVRAPGGALLGLGVGIGLGACARRFTGVSTALAAAVFLGYGAARLVAMALDGLPGPDLVAATAVEWTLGGLCAVASWRRARAGRDPEATGTA